MTKTRKAYFYNLLIRIIYAFKLYWINLEHPICVFANIYGYSMFSVTKDLSFKLNRDHTRYNYWSPYPLLYVDKLGLFDFFKIPVQVINISKSGMLAKVQTESQFSIGEHIIIKFDNYFTDVIPTTVMRWEADTQLLAVQFSRDIKLIERIALNIA